MSRSITRFELAPTIVGGRVTEVSMVRKGEAARRPRCFLLMRSDKDVSAAGAHGDVVTVFPDGEQRPSIWADDFVRQALDRLEAWGYDPSSDYLLVAGNLVATVTVACALARECETGPQLLFFDAARQGYVPRTVPGGCGEDMAQGETR